MDLLTDDERLYNCPMCENIKKMNIHVLREHMDNFHSTDELLDYILTMMKYEFVKSEIEEQIRRKYQIQSY